MSWDAAVLCTVVVAHEFVQDVCPLISAVREEVLPYRCFKGSIVPLHNYCLLVQVCGEVLTAMFLQEALDTDVVGFLTTVELGQSRVAADP